MPVYGVYFFLRSNFIQVPQAGIRQPWDSGRREFIVCLPFNEELFFSSCSASTPKKTFDPSGVHKQ